MFLRDSADGVVRYPALVELFTFEMLCSLNTMFYRLSFTPVAVALCLK